MNKSYYTETITGSKPTKKEPNKPKIPAKNVLCDFLNQLPPYVKVVSILPGGFSGFIVVLCEEEL